MKFNPNTVLIKPRITEKAAVLSESSNVYTFEVTKRATKTTIKRAVREIYNVLPEKINIVKLPSKVVFTKGKKGKTQDIRKAYVYLKKGDKIEIS